MWWLAQELRKREPGSMFGGTYARKPGYHNTRAALPSSDYSVQLPADKRGRPDVSSALDWTFPDAQRGDYVTIAKYSARLLRSGQDPHDTRLDGWREFYGQADRDSYVEGWDFQRGQPATSDKSHLWHIHFSELRENTESYANKQLLLDVLDGVPFGGLPNRTMEDDMPAGQLIDGFAYSADVTLRDASRITSVTLPFGDWEWLHLSSDIHPVKVRVATQHEDGWWQVDVRDVYPHFRRENTSFRLPEGTGKVALGRVETADVTHSDIAPVSYSFTRAGL
jgi:hypothetical protein